MSGRMSGLHRNTVPHMNFFTHFLGPNNVNNMATLAEDKLKSTVYHGE
jgi:hypothetical protein